MSASILGRLKELLGTDRVVYGKCHRGFTGIAIGSKCAFYIEVTVAGGKTMESMRQVASFKIGDDGELIEAELFTESGQGYRYGKSTAKPDFNVESVLRTFVADSKEKSPAYYEVLSMLQALRMPI